MSSAGRNEPTRKPPLTFVSELEQMRRYHLHESHVQGAVRAAVARAGITKRVSPHTLLVPAPVWFRSYNQFRPTALNLCFSDSHY
jgi:hypothetical protein